MSAAISHAVWEVRFTSWSVGPGKAEEEKMEHAVAAITTAIGNSTALGKHDIEILGTGSFKNRTHIKTESDVDVAVIYKDVFFNDWHFADPRAATDQGVVDALMREAGVSPATYEFADYKNEVEQALVDHFGRTAVKRGDKAFDIHENTYRVDSDCLACWEHRQWQRDAYGRLVPYKGIRFISDSGKDITNWPRDQFENGEAKHVRTGRQFKKLVRILKNLCNEMADAGIAAAKPIPSFLIESLVYRVPDGFFTKTTFYEELNNVLAYIAVNTSTDAKCEGWTEENEIKFLFHVAQPWTRQQASEFAMAAREFVGFE